MDGNSLPEHVVLRKKVNASSRDRILGERMKSLSSRNRESARLFVAACADGDVLRFREAVVRLDGVAPAGWRLAMQLVARLPGVSVEIREAFLSIWIEAKLLPLAVGYRRIFARGLRVLMPSGDCRRSPLLLYRGTDWLEYRRAGYGFSWTQYRSIARDFATDRSRISGENHGSRWEQKGIVLETLAPAEAVLAILDGEGSQGVGEVVVDPFKLSKVSVVEGHSKAQPIGPLPAPPEPLCERVRAWQNHAV